MGKSGDVTGFPIALPLPWALFQIFPVELFYLVKWDFLEIIIQVGMACAGDNQQFLVVPFQHLVSILAEIAGMGFLPVYQQHGVADFTGIAQDGHVQERKG